jgi:hypothetical protein
MARPPLYSREKVLPSRLRVPQRMKVPLSAFERQSRVKSSGIKGRVASLRNALTCLSLAHNMGRAKGLVSPSDRANPWPASYSNVPFARSEVCLESAEPNEPNRKLCSAMGLPAYVQTKYPF